MKPINFFASVLAITVLSSAVSADHLPIVRIWETPNANGGTYTISVDSTQSAFSWTVLAFAVTTSNDTTDVATSRSGWGADLISRADWDAGRDYELEEFEGDTSNVFSTGSGGVGSFTQVFGSGTQAAVFWTSIYFASGIGPNNTSSNFDWIEGGPASTAFALVSGGPNGSEFLACPVGLNGPAGECIELNAVPIPAAAWLFGSGLLALSGLRRRTARQ